MTFIELYYQVIEHFNNDGATKYQDYKGIATIDDDKSLRYNNIKPFEKLLKEVQVKDNDLNDLVAIGGKINISGERFYVDIICKRDSDLVFVSVHQSKPLKELNYYFDDISVFVTDYSVDLSSKPTYSVIHFDEWKANKTSQVD